MITDTQILSGSGTGEQPTYPNNFTPKYHAVKDVSNQVKNGIWLYFFLVIFEGALRKWVLPGLSTPLLIVRDPVAAYIIIIAWQRKLLPMDPGLVWMSIIGFLSILTAIAMGHGNLFVALFGARILLLHFPMIYIMGKVFDREDVIKMGKMVMMIAIPMTFLVAIQFYSPQSAWVNRGLGGDLKGAGFSGAEGFFRPPGTFSFTTGNTQFYSLVTCFVFYFLLNPKEINRIISISATVCLLAAIPLSISRSLFFQIALTGLFVFIASARNSKYIGKMILGGIIGAAALVFLSQYTFFQIATGALTSRFTNANGSEGGIEGTFVDRYLGGMVSALSASFSSKLPFFGYGIGMGTNVGSIFLSGKRGFFLSEEEWGRIISELGAMMGLTVIGIRVSLAFRITRAGFKKLSKGDSLTWILLSWGAISVAQGGWAQPTSLGFCVLIGGLMFAASKTPVANPKVVPLRNPVSQVNLRKP